VRGVAVGDPFPSIELQGSAGEAVRLGERTAGQPAVVYFYPKDATPGCTREARDFQRLWPRFRAAGIAVVGVSVDGPAAHRAFAADCGLEFPLLSDPGGALARALGILDPERGDGG
jgi:peroxiredoxin Q/BCP